MKFFIVTISFFQLNETGDIYSNASSVGILKPSKEEAYNHVMENLLRMYPEDKGYFDHRVQVNEVPVASIFGIYHTVVERKGELEGIIKMEGVHFGN